MWEEVTLLFVALLIADTGTDTWSRVSLTFRGGTCLSMDLTKLWGVGAE